MANDDLLTAAISELPPKYDCDKETRENLRKIALSPRFIFISLDELRFINDSDYSFNFSGDEVQIQKILLYLFSCDFYAMYCDKFFRTIENGVEHRIFRPWHMHNNLPNNMVANYVRYVIHTKKIADCDSFLSDEPLLSDNDHDPQLDYDPQFMPASTQYYILYSPYQEHTMYTTNSRPYSELCYRDTSPVPHGENCLESEATRVFTSREAVVARKIYYAIQDTWRIAVEKDGDHIERIKHTNLTYDSNDAYRSATTYIGPELPLPKCHTNNWWLDLHNFTLTADDIRASMASISSLKASDYISAFLYTHKNKFDDYRALADVVSTLLDKCLNDRAKVMGLMMYVNADPEYHLDLYEDRKKLFPESILREMCLLRYLVLRVYQRTITVEDLELYYLCLPAASREEFVNELFTLPVCNFNLFYPFVVDTSPSEGGRIEPENVCKMSFNKTLIRYRKSSTGVSQPMSNSRTYTENGKSPFLSPFLEGCSNDPIQMASAASVETSEGNPMKRKGDQASIIVTIDASMFASNPCGFEGIFSGSL